MKQFDVIIGNPPYTDRSSRRGPLDGGCSKTLDYTFAEQSVENASIVKYIIRAKFLSKKSNTFRRKHFSSGKLVSIVALPEETFPSITGTPTCIVTWSQTHTGSTKVVYLDGSVKHIDLTADTCLKLDNPTFVAEVENSLAPRYMRGRVKQRQLEEKPGTQPVLTSMGGYNGSMEDNIVYVDKSLDVDCVNQHGVVMNAVYQPAGARAHKKLYVSPEASNVSGIKVKATGPIYVKPYEYGISSPTVILKTSSYEESEMLCEYLMRDDVQAEMFYNKINNANTKELFATISDGLLQVK